MRPPTLCTYAPHQLANGKTIIDELCTCGFLRTQHHPLLFDVDGQVVTYNGKGPLGKCPQFTRKAFVFAPVKP